MNVYLIAASVFFILTTLVFAVLYFRLKFKNQSLEDQVTFFERSNNEFKSSIAHVELESKERQSLTEQKLNLLQDENLKLSNKVHVFQEGESKRQTDYEKKISQLSQVLNLQEQKRVEEEQNHIESVRQKHIELKKTWQMHEKTTEEKFDLLCQKYSLSSIRGESFPYRGRPDNSVLIGEEYVVFDSKSPEGESLDHFPQYIRKQAEALKKYTKLDKVKNEAFLVVPQNTIAKLKEKYFLFGEYKVYVISEESLEPILVQLKRLNDFEFTENLSPENKEALVTLVAKMSHGIKRKIQVDYYFSREFLTTLDLVERLPKDIFEDVSNVEKVLKVNPPNESRKKIIEQSELKHDLSKISNQLELGLNEV